ncbi:signal recognition particle, partial [Vibrio vulnificus]
MSFPLVAAPETTVLTPDQDWMPTTDLSLPRQMKIGALENGIRYVVMPSRYSQKTVSLRFELQTASNQTWLVANEADLNSRSLKEAFVELRDKVLVNDKVPAAPQSKLTVILVGDIQVRDAIDQIDIVFGGAKIGNSIPGRLFAEKLSPSLEQPVDAETSAQPVAANIYLKTRLTDVQEDSKMRRKELTASQLADDVLMARLEKQLLEANIGGIFTAS